MSFKDIKGHKKTIFLLQGYLKSGRLPAAYLFVGPDAVGKKLTAKTLAKALNCLESETDACGHCVSCIKIDKNIHPDFHIIDETVADESGNSDQVKFEAVRQLQKQISFRPYEARKKVFIIDNADHLTAEAANALLKVLEEPPKDSLIILISAKPARIFKTVISRCRILKFSSLPRLELQEIMQKDYQLGIQQAHFLAYFCEGRLGYALELKDADFFREKNLILDDFSTPGKYQMERELVDDKSKMRRYLNTLATWFRDIYILKTGLPQAELINLDRKEQLLGVLSRYGLSDLDGALHELADALKYLEQNVNSKLIYANLKYLLKG